MTAPYTRAAHRLRQRGRRVCSACLALGAHSNSTHGKQIKATTAKKKKKRKERKNKNFTQSVCIATLRLERSAFLSVSILWFTCEEVRIDFSCERACTRTAVKVRRKFEFRPIENNNSPKKSKIYLFSFAKQNIRNIFAVQCTIDFTLNAFNRFDLYKKNKN